jgi:hypothetical protein
LKHLNVAQKSVHTFRVLLRVNFESKCRKLQVIVQFAFIPVSTLVYILHWHIFESSEQKVQMLLLLLSVKIEPFWESTQYNFLFEKNVIRFSFFKELKR